MASLVVRGPSMMASLEAGIWVHKVLYHGSGGLDVLVDWSIYIYYHDFIDIECGPIICSHMRPLGL